MDTKQRKIAVIGLGYVGLPVAAAFAEHQEVIAFDKNSKRIADLKNGKDCTGECTQAALQNPNLVLTDNPDALKSANFYIIAVPTPVDEANRPDLSILLNASQTVGQYLSFGDIVVYESTVFPGATEEKCGPVLAQTSGLVCGVDFTLGYSPERINPGDKEHQLKSITKIVAGQDQNTLDIVAELYGTIIDAGIYRAKNIKTAEAAKVIENTQRDLNIALMNELALIFNRMGIDTHEVIDAASTKWNFLPFTPGLVGGHCIGVDPYYLTHIAQQYGYQPEVILAGRRINDNMGQYVAHHTVKQMINADIKIKGARVLILGITFKENCADIRNSKVIDIINELKNYGVECITHGAEANKEEVQHEYGISLTSWEEIDNIDAIILAVPHTKYLEKLPQHYAALYKQPCLIGADADESEAAASANYSKPILMDVKSALDRDLFTNAGFTIWRL